MHRCIGVIKCIRRVSDSTYVKISTERGGADDDDDDALNHAPSYRHFHLSTQTYTISPHNSG